MKHFSTATNSPLTLLIIGVIAILAVLYILGSFAPGSRGWRTDSTGPAGTLAFFVPFGLVLFVLWFLLVK